MRWGRDDALLAVRDDTDLSSFTSMPAHLPPQTRQPHGQRVEGKRPSSAGFLSRHGLTLFACAANPR